jgi:hypothetical protein
LALDAGQKYPAGGTVQVQVEPDRKVSTHLYHNKKSSHPTSRKVMMPKLMGKRRRTRWTRDSGGAGGAGRAVVALRARPGAVRDGESG